MIGRDSLGKILADYDPTLWRPIQSFLGGNSLVIFTVECYLVESGRLLFCDCPGFRIRRICIHTEYVWMVLFIHNGRYPVRVSKSEVVAGLPFDTATYRTWFAEHVLPEVLDADGVPVNCLLEHALG